MLGSIQAYTKELSTRRFFPWLVLAVGAFNMILIGGKRRSFGIFIASLHEDFNTTSMTEFNWIGDSYSALAFLTLPLTTTLVLYFNRAYRIGMAIGGVIIVISSLSSSLVTSPGQLFFTHTFLHGIGSSTILSITPLVIGEYFDKSHPYHVFATSFSSGGPYGIFLLGPILSAMINNAGWRIAFRFITIFFAVGTGLGALFFLPKEFDYDNLDGAPPPTKKKGFAFCSWDHIKANRQIMFWIVERVFHNIVLYGVLMNLTDFVEDTMNTNTTMSFMPNLVFGVGEAFIFTVGAIVGDRLRGSLPFVYLLGAFVSTVAVFITQFNLTSYSKLLGLSCLLGVGLGIGNTFLYAISEEVMLVHGSISYPGTKMIAGIGMIISPLCTGLTIDLFGYQSFFTCLLIFTTARLFLLVGINTVLLNKDRRARELDQRQTQELEDCTGYNAADPELNAFANPRHLLDEKIE